MLYFKLIITASVIFGIITVLFFILAVLYIFKHDEIKHAIFTTLAGLLTAIISVFAYINVTIPMPTILPLDYETQTYNDELVITINSNDKNAFETYYTLNGEDPQNGIKYVDKFIITESTTICARNKFWGKWSEITKNVYFINHLDEPTPPQPTTNEEPDAEPIHFNLGEEIKNIQRTYNNFQNSKETPIVSSVYPQVSIYYMSDNIASIEIQSGFNNINYSRIYFFNKDNQMYFALIFDKQKENRLYFKDNILISVC